MMMNNAAKLSSITLPCERMCVHLCFCMKTFLFLLFVCMRLCMRQCVHLHAPKSEQQQKRDDNYGWRWWRERGWVDGLVSMSLALVWIR